MGRVRVVRGNREQLLRYLRRHPEAQRLTLLISEDGEEQRGAPEALPAPPLEGLRVVNGVPLFPEVPNMVPLTVEMVNQLLNE